MRKRERFLTPDEFKRLGRALEEATTVRRLSVYTVTEGYAADWTIAQLGAPAQRIADRIEELILDSESVAAGDVACS